MKPRKAKPRNQCGACGEDFAGVGLFDAHRVGKHEYLWSPERPNGRRCLTPDEMRAKGWAFDVKTDVWSDPSKNAAIRERLGR